VQLLQQQQQQQPSNYSTEKPFSSAADEVLGSAKADIADDS